MGAMAWTERDDRVLRELATQGWSASQIGERMGKTRNSVIGRLYRLGICGTDNGWTAERYAELHKLWLAGYNRTELATAMGVSPGTISKRIGKLRKGETNKAPRPKREHHFRRPAPRPKREHHFRSASPRLPAVQAPPIQLLCEPVSFLDLQWHHCRYIVSEVKGAETLYCGARKALGSWCAAHAAACTVPVERSARALRWKWR